MKRGGRLRPPRSLYDFRSEDYLWLMRALVRWREDTRFNEPAAVETSVEAVPQTKGRQVVVVDVYRTMRHIAHGQLVAHESDASVQITTSPVLVVKLISLTAIGANIALKLAASTG
jgi:hypothetical protein